jgi:hypothetical protein
MQKSFLLLIQKLFRKTKNSFLAKDVEGFRVTRHVVEYHLADRIFVDTSLKRLVEKPSVDQMKCRPDIMLAKCLSAKCLSAKWLSVK